HTDFVKNAQTAVEVGTYVLRILQQYAPGPSGIGAIVIRSGMGATGGAPAGSPNAAARLPNLQGMSRSDAHITIRNRGFQYHGTTRGGYVRYTHADGSEIWIRPNGEVMRYGSPIEGRPGHPRLDRFGNPADHPADEFVSPLPGQGG